MLEPGLVEHERGLEEGVIQPRTTISLPCGRRAVGKAFLNTSGWLRKPLTKRLELEESIHVSNTFSSPTMVPRVAFTSSNAPKSSWIHGQHTAACWWLIFPGWTYVPQVERRPSTGPHCTKWGFQCGTIGGG